VSGSSAEASGLDELPVVRALLGALDVLRNSVPGFVTRALVDKKTGIFNGDALDEFAQAQFPDGNLWVVCLDLTGFKSVNDTLGHDAGDAALRAVADDLKRISKSRRAVPFRVGGDEFVILARPEGFPSLRRVLARLHWRGFRFDGHLHPFTTGKGAARGNRNMSFTDVRRRADESCRISKERGDRLVVWSPNVRAELPEKYRFRCESCHAVTDMTVPLKALAISPSYFCGNCGTVEPKKHKRIEAARTR
jgi:GGDEF domain-containing protein